MYVYMGARMCTAYALNSSTCDTLSVVNRRVMLRAWSL